MRANADALKEVIVELVRNGLEAMPDGGVLTITPEGSDPLARDVIGDTNVPGAVVDPE